MDRPPELPITEEDWSHTPLAVQAVVITLWQQVQALQAEVAQLRERLRQNSRNSSRPPSSDPPDAPPRPKRTSSGRKRGGQKGHRGHGRRLKPAEQVDRIVEVKPKCCAQCGALLLGEDPQPTRHQVTELPPVKPEVVEYRRHTITCLACGAQNRAEWPSDMPAGSFGPRVQATVGYFTGRIGTGQRDVQEVMVEEAQVHLRQQPVNNVDETSWREGTQRTGLWINTTPQVTVFWLLPGRGGQKARQVLGETFEGIVGSDRYSAYNWIEPHRRAACWAHLDRDFQAFCRSWGRVGEGWTGVAAVAAACPSAS